MDKNEKTKPTHTTTTEKPVAEVEFYRNTSTTAQADVISLNVKAPTIKEVSKLFTEKLKELNIK